MINMAKRIDDDKIIGVYGKLEIIDYAFHKHKHRYFNVKCSCDNIFTSSFTLILKGRTKTCFQCRNKTHSMSHTRLYKIYDDMKKRCYNTNCANYKFYGLKGVNVCEEWLKSPQLFLDWALANGYKDNLTIDRIDSFKNYEPSNCRFISKSEQLYNLRNLTTNKSGYKGISWSRKEKRWLAIISINNKSKRIGSFTVVKEACEARNKFIDENNLPHQKVEYKGEVNPY